MESVYQEPRWIAHFTLFEMLRGRATEEPDKCGECGADKPFERCRQCRSTGKLPDHALCRACELRFGYFLIDDWPRCAGCYFPFGNGLDGGLWVTRTTDRFCGYCDWVRQGYSIEKMLETIARELGSRFVARLELELQHDCQAVQYVADCMWHHRVLIEMLKHTRCTVPQAAGVFVRIAKEIVASVKVEEIEIDALAAGDGWSPDEARPTVP
jgi:hypothetical protein